MVGNTGAACPGLIEAAVTDSVSWDENAPNTGAACPGLIEARRRLAQRKNQILNTGAACPGLIEACETMEGKNMKNFEYRGSLPRPH